MSAATFRIESVNATVSLSLICIVSFFNANRGFVINECFIIKFLCVEREIERSAMVVNFDLCLLIENFWIAKLFGFDGMIDFVFGIIII